jgi:hypothetical protein
MSEIKFKLEFSDDNDVFLKWRGKYTVGVVNVRGTRVWFTTNCAEVVQSDHMNAKTVQNEIDDENNDFPDDGFNLREESLEMIIEKLTTDYKDYDICDRSYSVESNKNPTHSIYESLSATIDPLSLYPSTCVAYNLDQPDKEEQLVIVDYSRGQRELLYIVKDLDNMLRELKEVLNFCQKNNVTWIWV